MKEWFIFSCLLIALSHFQTSKLSSPLLSSGTLLILPGLNFMIHPQILFFRMYFSFLNFRSVFTIYNCSLCALNVFKTQHVYVEFISFLKCDFPSLCSLNLEILSCPLFPASS